MNLVRRTISYTSLTWARHSRVFSCGHEGVSMPADARVMTGPADTDTLAPAPRRSGRDLFIRMIYHFNHLPWSDLADDSFHMEQR